MVPAAEQGTTSGEVGQLTLTVGPSQVRLAKGWAPTYDRAPEPPRLPVGGRHLYREPVSRDPLAHPAEALARLYAYVSYRIGPGADAEDVVSETIERALRYRSSFDPRKGSANSWLFGIANRRIADHHGGEPSLNAADETADPFAGDLAARTSVRLDLARALSRMDERSRELLALRYGADLTSAEIGELTGLRAATVDVAMHRALAKLRALLDTGDHDKAPHSGPAQ